MDNAAAIADLRKALALLPKDMVKQLLNALFSNIMQLTLAWPELRRLMEPPVRAAMVAYPAGMIDLDELQGEIQLMVAEYLSD